MKTIRVVRFAVGVASLAITAACNSSTESTLAPSLLVAPAGQAGHVVVCKDGPAGTFGFTLSGVSAGVTLNATNVTANQFTLVDEECKDIGSATPGSSLTIEETSFGTNTEFVRADVYGVTPGGVQDGIVDNTVGNPTGSLTFGDRGLVVVFINQLVPTTTGCTYTKGYYRNHLATVTAQDGRSLGDTRSILDATSGKPGGVTWGSDNLLLNLYQQLLTALINLDGDDGPADVHTAVLAAQAGTAGTGLAITTTLTHDEMSDLVAVLTAFNEGSSTGWPHCAD